MASGTINVKVRPLRIGFLVDPADRVGLYRAIELSSFFWGGSYNPIIPAYLRTPVKWESHGVRHRPSPSEIIDGYLSGFDPDLIVPVGTCGDRAFQVGNRDVVAPDELIGDLKKSFSPNYGVGIFDVIRGFMAAELRYKRNDDLQIVFPELPRAYRLFLASVFGVLPGKAQQIVEEHFFDYPFVSRFHPTLVQFLKLVRSPRFFPRRLISWGLKEPMREAQLFICDATSALDIIDYWNLRAAGFYVLPVPIQAAEARAVVEVVQGFIEENYRPHNCYDWLLDRVTIRRSRSLSEEVVTKFCQSLDPSKFTMSPWYPRLWDTWARASRSEEIVFPFSGEQERRISDGETTVELQAQGPSFDVFNDLSGKPRFANNFSFRFYGSKEPMAEVFPEGSRELSSAIGRIGYHNWRFSRLGPVFLAHHVGELIFVEVPLAEAVMKEWFRERGWKVSLSGPGKIAKQLLRQLGGTQGSFSLAHKGVIKLLGELEKEAGLSWPAVIQSLKAVTSSAELPLDAEQFLERLLRANALRLGLKIQCPDCTRYNWYELDALDYELRCRFCLSVFPPPLESPKNMEWTYRAYGPFTSSIAQGAFTVVLTLNLLSRGYSRGITPLFSYTAEKGGKCLEADLTCLYRLSTERETETHVVHAECKSYNQFEPADIKRMENLASAFPGAVLIFAKLSQDLEEGESGLISDLAISERENRLCGRPSSPVIILTGNELFSSFGIESGWRGKGGLYEQLSEGNMNLAEPLVLADATQQLYLNLPSWSEWFNAKLGKRKMG